jgi:hypothetical protein
MTPGVFTEGQVLWSLKDVSREMGSMDDMGEWHPAGYARVDIYWTEWTVEKVTPNGAWVFEGHAGDRVRGERIWVANNTRKVAATKTEAKARAVEKRAWHAKECRKRLERAEHQLRVLENLKVEEGT